MRTHSRPLVLALLMLVAAAPAPAGPITEEFVGYIKKSLNGGDFGLRENRFYPYSTVRGWRIGYRHEVTDKKWFRAGIAKDEADKMLRADLDATLAAARAWATKNKVKPFDQWSQASKEIFLDLAHTEGVDGLSPALTTSIVKQDWQTLVFQNLYLRWYSGAPDLMPNNAFGARWVYSAKLIPNIQTGPSKVDDEAE